jgi:hypothetical protein
MRKVKGLPEKMYLSGVSLLIAPFLYLWFQLPSSDEAYYPTIIILVFIILASLTQTVVFYLLKNSSKYRWYYGLSLLTIIGLIVAKSPTEIVLLGSTLLCIVNSMVVGYLLPKVKQ